MILAFMDNLKNILWLIKINIFQISCVERRSNIDSSVLFKYLFQLISWLS